MIGNAASWMTFNTLLGLAVISFVLLLGFVWFGRKAKSRSSQKRQLAKRIFKTLQKIEHAPQAMAYLKNVDAYAFEELLLDSFERRGFKVIRNKRYSHDGGIDGRVIIRGHTFLVQAKRYKEHIKPLHVETFHQLCTQEQTYGFFIHTGKTGPMSKAYHHDRIAMISGETLLRFINQSTPIRMLLNEKHFVDI